MALAARAAALPWCSAPAHATSLDSPPQAWLASVLQALLPWLTAESLCSPPPCAELTSEKRVEMKSMFSCIHVTSGMRVQVTGAARTVLH